MLNTFIIWLATKFLSHTKITQLFSDTVFKERGTEAITSVLLLNNDSSAFTPYALRYLADRFDHDALGHLYALTILSETYIGTPDNHLDLLVEISEAAETKNLLKGLKDISTLITNNTTITEETAIKSMAHALYVKPIANPVAAHQFLKEI